MGGYVPYSSETRDGMLQFLKLGSLDELYAAVPSDLLVKELDLPAAKSELEVRRMMEGFAAQNTVYKTMFRGAGAYRHYIPSIVRQVTSKESFVTAYTPYQAEISQGILQVIFEYQSEICALTGMDTSNASVYDGATAAAEAVAMCRERKRQKAIVVSSCHPDTLAVINTYSHSANAPVEVAPLKDGVADVAALSSMLNDETACVYVQSPNYYGLIEDVAAISEACHAAGVKVIMGCNPIALALFQTPAELGADIAVGDGQPLGMPLAFGGPYLGFMACKKDMTRKMPGRIAGQTTDAAGNRCFVLTLQAREQHIRREKALSSVCSNQALCALTATVYIAAMGETGIAEAASQCYAKAHYMAAELANAGFKPKFGGEFFHEFVTECPGNADDVLKALSAEGILGGLPVDGGILWCCTELNTKDEIDRAVAACKKAVGK